METITIRVCTEAGIEPRQVQAIETRTEGLAVTPASGCTWWTVTHVHTGSNIPLYFPEPNAARSFADGLSGLTDWSLPDPPRRAEMWAAVRREAKRHKASCIWEIPVADYLPETAVAR